MNRTIKEYKEQDQIQRSDHDSLLRMEGKVDQLIDAVQNLKDVDIKELKDGTTDKITDLQKRVSVLEFWRNGLIAAWGVTAFVLIFFWNQWAEPFISEVARHINGK